MGRINEEYKYGSFDNEIIVEYIRRRESEEYEKECLLTTKRELSKGMAHNFVGFNNINLLSPSGQFGSHVYRSNNY